MKAPKLVVFSSLFPNAKRPGGGVFIRERMFRVGEHVPIVIVSPVPWFPFQGIIRLWKPFFRPQPAKYEDQDGVQVYFPRFVSIPGFFKSLDGFFMALCSFPLLRKLKKQNQFNLIDAHFAYPDGYAASLLGKWLDVPVTITLRGTEVPLSKILARKNKMLLALKNVTKVFSVANSLKEHVVKLGADSDKIEVIGNAVDTEKFFPIDKNVAREQLGIDITKKVIISVGGLVDRKGFHRVIEVMPSLVKKYPELVYLIVGGNSPEGGIQNKLENLVKKSNLQSHVRFLGSLPSEELKIPLSAADVFILATSNEGWANVFLEAMACGLPVVTTDVGGNKEVVNSQELGIIVPFGRPKELEMGIDKAIETQWNKERILSYARQNNWEKRVSALVYNFKNIVNEYQAQGNKTKDK